MKTTKIKDFCRFRNPKKISKKRGMIELQFHWIFVIIAGAVIFVFFINIVNKQREFSEIKTSGTIITSLESILIGAQISTDTVNIIDMPKVEIGFECNRYFIGPVPKQTKENVIFSPNLLKGKQLIAWALDWNMPYRVTNFLYITDPELRYIIVNKADTPGSKIFDELPEEINKELINSGENVINKNNYKVKFIFFDDNYDPRVYDKEDDVLTNLKKMPDEDVTGVVLHYPSPSEIIPNVGNIEFLEKRGSIWITKGIMTTYIKKEGLFGAIFAEDVETYNCVMRKAFKKLNLVTKIYLDRSDYLEWHYFPDNPCYDPHGKAKTDLDNIERTSAEEINDFPNRGLRRMQNMESYSANIKNENQRAQLFSCALIY